MTDPFYLYKSYNDAHPEAPAGEKKVYGSEGFSPEDITDLLTRNIQRGRIIS